MSTAPAHARPARSRARRALNHPLTHLFAAVLLLALIQGFVVKVFAVPSGSMEHTLEVGDRILVNRLATEPQSGDIIVFRADDTLWPPTSGAGEQGAWQAVKHSVKWLLGDVLGFGPTTGHTLVKRVIGTEGQTVSCCGANGGVLVDGIELVEPYIFEDPPFSPGTLDCMSTPTSNRCFEPIEVPAGLLLVMGDHRGASSDGVAVCRGNGAGVVSGAGSGSGSGSGAGSGAGSVAGSASGTETESASESASGTSVQGSAAVDPGTSSDCARFVRADDVYGEVFTIIWPLSRFGAPEASG